MKYCEVAPIGVLHEDAKGVAELLKEGLLVGDDVGRVNGGQEPDLVECIVLLLGVEVHQFDLLKGEHLIGSPVLAHLDDPSETAGP